MARGQVRRTQIQQTKRPTVQVQSEQMVFAMDIGTRSVIGMVGIVEEGKVRIVAIEKEEHTERAMIDGRSRTSRRYPRWQTRSRSVWRRRCM